MRKSLAAATMAASLTVGGAAGVALFQPTLSGAQTDTTTDTAAAHPDRAQWLADALAPLVADGTINQEQADAVADALRDASPRPGRFRHGLRGEIGESIADVLGLTGEEIRAELQAGSTLGGIADAQGVDRQAVIDAIVADVSARLDQAVTGGRLTEEEAAAKQADAAARAEEMLDRTFDGDGRRDPGRRHGHADPAGDDEADTNES